MLKLTRKNKKNQTDELAPRWHRIGTNENTRELIGVEEEIVQNRWNAHPDARDQKSFEM